MTRKLIVFIAFVLINTAANAQKEAFTFKEIKTDTINKKFKSILFLGVGYTATRIFLDNLAPVLIKKFKAEKINSEYYYLGKASDTLSETFLSLLKNKYDAILIFTPKDTNIFKTVNTVITGRLDLVYLLGLYFIIPNHGISQVISYHQNFNLDLFSQEDKSNSIWNANMVVDFGMFGLSNYQNIAKKYIGD